MATNERRALMRHLGLKLLEHSMVEVREVKDSWSGEPRKIAVLKDFSEPRRIWTGDPGRIEQDYARHVRDRDGTLIESYRDYIASAAAQTFAYADLQVCVEGLFLSPLGEVWRYMLDEYGNQSYRRYTNGRVNIGTVDQGRTVDLRNMQPVTLRTLPRDKRLQLMWGMADDLCDSQIYKTCRCADAIMTSMRTVLGYNPDVGGIPTPDTFNVYGYRTAAGLDAVRNYQFTKMRDKLKAAGRLIGNPDTPVSEFLNLVTEMNGWGWGYNFVGQMTDAWAKVHPDSRLIQCHCGHLEEEGEVTEARGGRTVCRQCIENGVWHFMEDLQQYDNGGYEHMDGLWYTYSEFSEEDDEDSDESPGVRSYGADVRSYLTADKSIVPSSYGEFLMGIELEVVPWDNQRRAVADTMENLAPGYAILKNDGSLDDGGFEIVTAPRGLQEHIKRFSEWKPYSTLRAWDAGCCGMHVHVSSQAFTASTLGKFIEFINSEKNDDFIRSIAGRHPHWDEQARDYCQRDGCEIGNPKKTLDGKSTSRYFMVNTTNLTAKEAERLGLGSHHAVARSQNTIEIRVFKASLKKARLLAQIEFAHAAVMFCRWSSMRELDEKHFLKWLKGMAGIYPNLAKWFGVRGNTDVVDANPKVKQGADV